MIDLNTFIKCDFLRESLKSNGVIIKDISDVKVYVLNLTEGLQKNVIFENSQLKDYLFEHLRDQGIQYEIVNCNATEERFYESFNTNYLRIYNNVGKCKSQEILKVIQNNSGIIMY